MFHVGSGADERECLLQGLEQVEWDEDDPESDPSSRFPFGT